jgi:hypothetical protein
MLVFRLPFQKISHLLLLNDRLHVMKISNFLYNFALLMMHDRHIPVISLINYTQNVSHLLMMVLMEHRCLLNFLHV